jgi:hypothetical protein
MAAVTTSTTVAQHWYCAWQLRCARQQAGHWRGLDDMETATCGWVGEFNHQRFHGELNDLTPVIQRQMRTTANDESADLPICAHVGGIGRRSGRVLRASSRGSGGFELL